MLLVLMIQQRCALTKPWLYLSEYFAKHRQQYVDCLLDISVNAAWAEWVEFCLCGVAEVAASTVLRCERLRDLRIQYLTRLEELGGSGRLHQIMEDLFRAPILRVADLTRRFDKTYPTAKADVERLIEAGILSDLSGCSVRTVFAHEIFRIAYADLD